MIVQCKCDCGTEFEEFDNQGRKRKFINGHQRRGKTNSPETKQKISENHPDFKGENNPMFGKHHSPKSKRLMSVLKKGKKLSEEHKRKIGINQPDNSGEKNPMYGKRGIGTSMYGRRGENHPSWNGGTSRLPYCPIWSLWLKEEIKERDNHQCMNPNCNKEITKINNLNVHHIDYNKKNCSTNNLITLCRSCNSKANFNRDYWKELYSNILMEKTK